MKARVRAWLRRMRAPMPLLSKELLEQAARRRTYIVRVAYAAALFLIFAIGMGDVLRYRRDFDVLGSGRQFFELLLVLEFGGIAVFLPAMMSGVITYEKERESLALLFLTDLGPWEIVLQKYLGRLLPMISFLLLGMPLMAVSYAYGGIEAGHIWIAGWCLLLAALQVGAFSLMMSAWCRTSTAAFISSYVFGGVLYLGPLLALLVLVLWFQSARFVYASAPNMSGLLEWCGSYNPALLFVFLFYNRSGSSWAGVLLRSLPALGLTGVFLLGARRFLVSRAFLPAKQRLLRMFKKQDAFWTGLNRLTGGVILVKDGSALPEDKPIAWREVTRKPLGKLNYLLRLMLMAEVPLVLFYVTIIGGFDYVHEETYYTIYFCLWGIAVLAIVARGANVVPSERTSQSLEVLLTTPLTGREIVRQKMAGVQRLMLVFVVPLITAFGVHAYIGAHRYASGKGWWYFAAAVATTAVYLPLFAWFAMWIGLWSKTRLRGLLTSLTLFIAWAGGPVLVLAIADEFLRVRIERSFWAWSALLSPGTVVPFLEFGQFESFFGVDAWLVVAVNLLWHGFLLYAIRAMCIMRADRYLGRAVAGRRASRPLDLPGVKEASA